MASKTLIVLGTDGAGKTTAITELVAGLQAEGIPAQQLANSAGRLWLNRMARRLSINVPEPLQDVIETSIRFLNVALNSINATRFRGLSVMDRHVYCQLVLRRLRGRFAGILLPWAAGRTTRHAVIVVLDVPPMLAFERITSREDDYESLEYLGRSRAEYLKLARTNNWPVIDSSQPMEQVVAQLRRLAGRANR